MAVAGLGACGGGGDAAAAAVSTGSPDGTTAVVAPASGTDLPVTDVPQSAQVPALDLSTKALSLAAYQRYYLSARAVPLDWTGSVSGCNAGSTSSLWRNSVLRQVNYARALAGLPGTVLDDAGLSAKAQAAALMMQANNALNHSPPTTWACYSAAGAEAAGSSNLALGTQLGKVNSAIDLYLSDTGSGSLGHRRWVLYPPQVVMGTGDTVQANALWVFGPWSGAASGTVAPDGVPWPPKGYVPRPLVSAAMAWSYGLALADFSAATVTVKDGNAQNVAVTPSVMPTGYGDNTLAFQPSSGTWPIAGTADASFDVSIAGIVVAGVSRGVSYRVTLFTPS